MLNTIIFLLSSSSSDERMSWLHNSFYRTQLSLTNERHLAYYFIYLLSPFSMTFSTIHWEMVADTLKV